MASRAKSGVVDKHGTDIRVPRLNLGSLADEDHENWKAAMAKKQQNLGKKVSKNGKVNNDKKPRPAVVEKYETANPVNTTANEGVGKLLVQKILREKNLPLLDGLSPKETVDFALRVVMDILDGKAFKKEHEFSELGQTANVSFLNGDLKDVGVYKFGDRVAKNNLVSVGGVSAHVYEKFANQYIPENEQRIQNVNIVRSWIKEVLGKNEVSGKGQDEGLSPNLQLRKDIVKLGDGVKSFYDVCDGVVSDLHRQYRSNDFSPVEKERIKGDRITLRNWCNEINRFHVRVTNEDYVMKHPSVLEKASSLLVLPKLSTESLRKGIIDMYDIGVMGGYLAEKMGILAESVRDFNRNKNVAHAKPSINRSEMLSLKKVLEGILLRAGRIYKEDSVDRNEMILDKMVNMHAGRGVDLNRQDLKEIVAAQPRRVLERDSRIAQKQSDVLKKVMPGGVASKEKLIRHIDHGLMKSWRDLPPESLSFDSSSDSGLANTKGFARRAHRGKSGVSRAEQEHLKKASGNVGGLGRY